MSVVVACDYLGCTNPVDKTDWPWRMCDECADEAWAVEDSNYAECTCGHYYDGEHSDLGTCLINGCGCRA